jgi:hypothetical protein
MHGPGDVHAEFWSRKLKEIYYYGNLDYDGWITLQCILKN